jgi:hypothetical protein
VSGELTAYVILSRLGRPPDSAGSPGKGATSRHFARYDSLLSHRPYWDSARQRADSVCANSTADEDTQSGICPFKQNGCPAGSSMTRQLFGAG